MYKHFLKRVFDILLSLIAIIILALPMLIIALAIKIDSRGPVIFKQERVGKKGKVFKIYKFRTMCVGAEKMGSGVYSGKGDARVTKVGKFLRATSLDEITQLFNLLKGDMSFIGPRPPLTYHPWTIDKYTDEQRKMFNVRPGITGWAQVNGRKEVEWHKRIELNVWYVEHLSLWLDIKIFFMTFFKVFTNANNENTGATVKKEEPQNTLKLMYITNNPQVAQIAEDAGVDRIFIDMEYIGKTDRQGGMDTVQCHHTVEDVAKVKQGVKKAKLMVRCNPIHEATEEYTSSKEEIDEAIAAGADILMLPYFKSAEEVKIFIQLVDGRAKILPLVETPEAVTCIDEILALEGIDEIFIGLNDLSLGYGMKFMFELLANGTVETLCEKFKAKGIPYGFGGIAALGKGMLPSEYVIAEHYRLGSTCAILSRSFCNTKIITDLEETKRLFTGELDKIRNFEKECASGKVDFKENKQNVASIVQSIVEKETEK